MCVRFRGAVRSSMSTLHITRRGQRMDLDRSSNSFVRLDWPLFLNTVACLSCPDIISWRALAARANCLCRQQPSLVRKPNFSAAHFLLSSTDQSSILILVFGCWQFFITQPQLTVSKGSASMWKRKSYTGPSQRLMHVHSSFGEHSTVSGSG